MTEEELDKQLSTFFETDEGKVALSALMVFAGWNDMPTAQDVATANFENGKRAVIARILTAYARRSESLQEKDPFGFR